jgi:hypothetical protein
VRSPAASRASQAARYGAERTTPGINRYLYENLVSNVESQIEHWTRKAASSAPRDNCLCKQGVIPSEYNPFLGAFSCPSTKREIFVLAIN